MNSLVQFTTHFPIHPMFKNLTKPVSSSVKGNNRPIVPPHREKVSCAWSSWSTGKFVPCMGPAADPYVRLSGRDCSDSKQEK